MATVYRKRKKDGFASPYWFARYKLANGKYAYKKTGLTKKREAQRLANPMHGIRLRVPRSREMVKRFC